MFFDKYEKINYTVGNRTFEIIDLLTRVSILTQYSSSKVFDEYYIQAGETPEDVAFKVYNNDYYFWIILMVNNIISEDEWYSGEETFTKIMNKYHSGESYYITNLPNILPGDVMVKVTSTSGNEVTAIDETKYRFIQEFNKEFRYIWGNSGTGTFSVGDKIMFGRKNSDTGIVEPLSFTSSDDISQTTQFATVKFIEEKRNSPIYFERGGITVPSNVVFSSGAIQPEYIPYDTVYTSSTSSDANNFYRTLLYYYMSNSGIINSDINKFTFYDYEYNKYNERQKIKILKPEYMSAVVETIKESITNGEIGKRIIIGI